MRILSGLDLKNLYPFFSLSHSSRRCGIERDEDLLAELVAGRFDGFADDLQRIFVVLQIGREAAFIADGGAHLVLVQHFLQRVITSPRPAHRFAEWSKPHGWIMNSWKSTLLSACLPPLRMFIIGTGSVFAPGPPR